MAKDFLSDQIRVKQLIGSGSNTNPKLVVYPDNVAPDSEGTMPTGLLDNVGQDVFLLVSGTIDGKANDVSKSVTLFGGDVVVSGTLYAERQIIEVDATQTGSLEVSGSITHEGGINIGDAEDNDYTDGLFTDFTSSTLLGTAIDRINEVLKGLAPRQAPDLEDFDVDTSNGISGILSFGTDNDQNSNGYPSVLAQGGYSAVNVNGTYSPSSPLNLNYRLGIYSKDTEISGDLNESKSDDTYTNSVVNYPENSFSSADQGSLKLFLNGVEIHAIDLTDLNIGAGNSGSGTGSHLNANGSGFFDLSAATNGKFASEQTFATFKHRTGKWKVSTTDQTNGFNYVQVKHVIGSDERVTGVAQWVNDNNADSLSVSSKSLSLTLTGSKHLSGVEYFTGGNAAYTANIDNFYKFVYGDTPVSYSVTSSPTGSSLSLSNSNIPQINTSTEDHTKVLTLSTSSNIGLPGSGRIITGNSGFEVRASVTHPRKSLSQSTTSAIAQQILIDNASQSSTEEIENFDDENYRLKSTTYSSQADVNNSNNVWDSTQTITSGNTGYSDGLLIHNGRLYSTKNTGLVNSGNFSTLTNGPSGNPDYSNGNIATGTKRYIRKFTNTTGSEIRDISYSIQGVGDIRSHSYTLGSDNNNFKLYFKLPQSTAWLDAASDFVYNDFSSDGDGGKIGSFTSNIGSNPTNYLTFGTNGLPNNESILVKIESNKSWQGNIDTLQVGFGAVGTVLPSPDTDNIDVNDTGATAKLSFGTNLVKSGYTNVSALGGSSAVNANSVYSVSSFSNNIRKGVFNGNQTIDGEINEDVSSSGNSYPSNAWGSGKANVGELKLELNGTIIAACTIDLTTFGSGNVLNGNNTGFVNISQATVGADSNNLPDYRYFYRTGSFQINPADQRDGWNYVRVIHDLDGGTNVFETNYAEWVNNDSNTITYSSLTIDNGSFAQGSTSPNYLSGISYFTSAQANFSLTAANVYKYVYSNSGSAISFPTTTNSTVQSITVNGTGVVNGTVNSSSRSLPDLDTSVSTAYDENIEIESSFRFDINKSIPGSLQTATLSCSVNHPIHGNVTSSTQASSSPLIYTVNDTESSLVENFSAESYRLQSGTYANQTDVNGGSWDSTQSLIGANVGHNSGLQFLDSSLVAPSLDFSNSTSLVGPVNNPDYSTATGVRTFYRKFENTTSNSQFGFELRIKGTGSNIVDNTTTLATNNIKVFAKIPNTSNSQTTGFMDLALPFNTGQTSDNDGCHQGTFTSAVSNSGTGTSNNVSFGTRFLSPGDFVVIKIEADSSWSGSLNRIEIVWS
jgi:hypothetical protein